MTSAEEFSGVISDVYDAALDPRRWPAALEQVCRFVQGICSGLVLHDALLAGGQAYFAWGDDPAWTKLYFGKYIKLNPLVVPGLMMKVGDVVSNTTFMSQEDFQATQFYKEWMAPQRYVDMIFANLHKAPTSYTGVIVVRDKVMGVADEGSRHRMALLVPHLSRATTIGKIIELRTVEATALSETLDGLAAAVFLLDASGRLVFANLSGQALLERGEVLRNRAGTLGATSLEADPVLRRMVSSISTDDAVAPTKSALPLTASNGEPYVGHLLPLTSGLRRRTGAYHEAVAAFFVRKVAADVSAAFETVAQLYQLTPAELRVLAAIAQEEGVTGAAAALEVSPGTVRSHLRRLFDKTGVHRQADLIKLVSGFASPFDS
jgi:DNA-binding CsgD family transcriptional regulator